MKLRLALALLAISDTTATVTAAAPPGQVRAEDLLARTTDYIADFIRRFSNVVCEEQYVQKATFLPRVTGTGFGKTFDQPTPVRLVLRSEFLLVRREASAEWNTFRDVFEVDGRTVRNRDERLMKLLTQPAADADDRARKVAAEGARYNLGGAGRTINNPLIVIGLLQRHYQSRYRFAVGKPDAEAGPNVVVLEYKEVARPTLLRPNNRDQPAMGRVWIDSDIGRILKTELVLGGSDRVVTTFRYDERFQIAVPADMQESFGGGRVSFEGRAIYGQFRRFGVSTEEKLQ
jgi:hypothetical protein